MNRLATLLLAALLPIASAQPQTFATPAGPFLSGFITPAFSGGATGLQRSTGPCNGINATMGSYLTTQGADVWANVLPFPGLDCILSASGIYDLRVGTQGGGFTQNRFSYIRVVDCDGVTRIFTSASATFATSGSDRTWTWGAGASPVLEIPCTGTSAQFLFYR